MGCDIHVHVEIWLEGEWRHYSAPRVERDYLLFSYMADVRNSYGVTPIAQPRGLPASASAVTRYESAAWDCDGHSHSWLAFDEMQGLECLLKARGHPFQLSRAFGPILNPDEFDDEEGIYYDLTPRDVRVVFWFDN